MVLSSPHTDLQPPAPPQHTSPGVMLIVCDSSILLLPHIYATFSAAVLRRCELCGHAAVALRQWIVFLLHSLDTRGPADVPKAISATEKPRPL